MKLCETDWEKLNTFWTQMHNPMMGLHLAIKLATKTSILRTNFSLQYTMDNTCLTKSFYELINEVNLQKNNTRE